MNEDGEDMDIAINTTQRFRGVKISQTEIEKLVHSVCKAFTTVKNKSSCFEINIAIVDDGEIRKINNNFRKSDTVTDCLSFDLSDADELAGNVYEIIVNGERALQQADKRGHNPKSELALYIVHGLLHNLGFNDERQDEAKQMHEAEDKILQELGYGSVYNH